MHEDETEDWGPDDQVGLPPDEGGSAVPVPGQPQSEAPAATERVELGDHVHFVLPIGPNRGQNRLAVVSAVPGKDSDVAAGTVDLHVYGLPDDHPNVSTTHLVHFAKNVRYSKEGEPGTWHRAGEGEGK